MMLTKTEGRLGVPRDGRHCDLCGCSQPAVRCDKCGRQIFCLSCDDMYHRHPKRRFHMRKAVDTTPPTSMARPVLPAKGHALGGDPSKMPLPPPRKKKPGRAESFFSTFRRRSPSAEGGNSPPLPKKEYSWTDRFGNIKKFMSNRPLPPLPPQESNGAGEESPQGAPSPSTKHDLSFIHKKVDERPPQLPQRSLKPNEMTRDNQQTSTNGVRDMRNGTLNHTNRNNGFAEESQWNNNRAPVQAHPNTLMRQQGYMYPGSQGYPGALSASATDLNSMQQPPMYPHFPPGYPPHYPMYPQGYPGYFGTSFADISNHPTTTTEQDLSDDQSTDSSRPPPSGGGKRYQFRKRAKRSQSVMMDKMAYPGQFFPFGPFPPGYPGGPWGVPSFEPPPSSSPSRVRSRRRKKTTSEDDSSPLSRPSSSSGRQNRRPPVDTSSSEDEEKEAERNHRVPRRNSDPKKSPITRSPQVQHKNMSSNHKKVDNIRSSNAEDANRQNIAKVERKSPSPQPPKDAKAGPSTDIQSDSPPAIPWTPTDQWECAHCTYVNPAGNRICQVCCKTATTTAALPTAQEPCKSPTAAAITPQPSDSRPATRASELSCPSPEKKKLEEEEEEEELEDEGKRRDMAVLNSALDEAEKEISRGLEELLKLKEDYPATKPTPTPPPTQARPESSRPPQTPPPSGKPVYKSSGKLRSANPKFIDKITNGSPQPTSRCIETQTSTNDDIRRGSTSSTASDAYNSPAAQSPVLERAGGNGRWRSTRSTQSPDYGQSPSPELERRGSGSQRYSGKGPRGHRRTTLDDYRTRNSDDTGYFERGRSGYLSPFERSYHPPMQRSHSRASLFTGRMTDLDYGGPGPMFRSVSRGSLTGDYPDNGFGDFHNLRKPGYYLSMEELVERRRQETIRAQGLELVRMIREAEQQGFTADDIQVALQNCAPHQTPVEWLQDNWRPLAAEVVNLCLTYARDKREDDVGVVSDAEAREALRLHKGDVWPAVTECVESRQRKFLELKARGKFSTKAITDALSANQGDVELAYAKLTAKSSSKPFLMRIWGAGEGAQNQDVPPKTTTSKSPDDNLYHSKDEALSDGYKTSKDLQDINYYSKDDVLSDETWDDDDVEWDEDEEMDEEQQGDIEDLHTCHEDIGIKTPDSDPSEYCDAYGSKSNTLDRNISLPSPTEPETKLTRRGSFLSKLAGLKKNNPSRLPSPTGNDSSESSTKAEEDCSTDQTKSYNPISVIKNTFSAIRDTVGGGQKTDKKLPCISPERRTIVVKGQIYQESQSVASGDASGITLTSVKPLKDNEIITLVSPKVSDNSDLSKTFSENSNKPLTASSDLKAEDSKLQERLGKNETSIIQEQTTKETINDNQTSKSKEISSHQVKNSKKINQDNKGQDNLKTAQKTESFIASIKENVVKEITSSTSLETGSKPKKLETNENKETINNKIAEGTEQTLLSKIPSAEIPNTCSSPFKVSKQEKSLQSLQKQSELQENRKNNSSEAKNAVLHKPSIDLDRKSSNEATSLASSSKSDTESLNETQLNTKSEHEDETPSNNIKSKNAPSLENVKKQSLNNHKTSTASSRKLTKTENFVDDSASVPEKESLFQKEEIPLIDDDNEALEAGILQKDNVSPTFKSMEPIHSSTFKRSISSHSIEPKLDAENVSENKSMESKESHSSTIIFKDVSKKNEANENQTSNITEADQSTASVGTVVKDQSLSSSKINTLLKSGPQTIIAKTEEPHSESFNDKADVSKSPSDPFHQSCSKLKETLIEDTPASVPNAFDATASTSSSSMPSLPNISTTSAINTSATVSSDSILTTAGSNAAISTAPCSDNISISSITSTSNANLSIVYTSPTATSSSSPTVSSFVNFNTKFSSSSISEYPHNSVPDKNTNTNSIVVSTANASHSISAPTEPPTLKDSTSDFSLKNSSQVVSPASNDFTSAVNSSSTTSLTTASVSPTAVKSTLNSTSLSNSFPVDSSTALIPTTNASSERDSPYALASTSTTASASSSSTTLPLEILDAQSNSEPTASSSTTSKTTVTTVPITETASIPPDLSTPIDDTPVFVTDTTSVSITNASPSNKGSLVPETETASLPITNIDTPVKSTPEAVSATASLSKEVGLIKDTPEATSKVSASSNDTIATESKTSSISSTASTIGEETTATASETSLISTNKSTSIKNTSDTISLPATVSTVIKDALTTESEATSLPTNESSSIKAVPETDSKPTNVSSSTNNTSATTSDTASLPTDIRSQTNDEQSSSESEDDSSLSIVPPSPVDALRHRFEGLASVEVGGPVRPASPFRRMSFRSIKGAIAIERTRDASVEKPWFTQKPKVAETKKPVRRGSLKQQMENERRVRQLVTDRKVRTYRKAEIVVQLEDAGFSQEEAVLAANECSNFEMALSYLQQECLLCAGHFPVSHIVSMVHCPHKACRDCIRAYFTVQIRDRNIMELLCPFCNEPDITDDDIAQDYFNHLDMMLKKLVDPDIHELFQRKLRDRVLMRDPSFRWCSQCSSGFLAMENMQRLVCPDCNAVTCSSCRRPWEKEHQGITCEAFAALKDGNDPEAQAVSLAKMLTENGIDCPRCHFRYQLAKGGCMHFRCTQCQHDFCSGCYRPFKMGRKCGVSEFCAKLGLHAHHPRNCLFYLRDKDPEDLQRLLDLSEVPYDRDPPEGENNTVCQVMEQKETADGLVDDCCGKEVEQGFAGLCRLHYVEYLGQLVNRHEVDPIAIFENDDLELVLRRANIRLPPRRYREADESYRVKLVNLINEELPLDKMDGS